jgi:ribokinase
MRPSALSNLAVLGAINWDTTVFEQKFAAPGEEVPVRSVEETPGGKGANAAVAAARILGPDRVSIIGALGDDETSSKLRDSLRAEGVLDDSVISVSRTPSGRAYIVVDGSGSKTIHTLFGANEKLSSKHLFTPRAKKALSTARTVLIMDVPVPVALIAARMAKEAGASVVYSPGVRSAQGVRPLESVLRFADVLVVDRSELSHLTGPVDPVKAASKLQRKFPGLSVVATLGPLGCAVVLRNSRTIVPGIDLRDLDLKAVNSTGSGDAFLGAFVSYRILGRGQVEAARLGNLAGALKATKSETRGSPTRNELERAMNRLSEIKR